MHPRSNSFGASPVGYEHPLRGSNLPKHFVVTGFVVDHERHRVLLLFHRKLQRWLPPGGHVEATEDPLRALLREVREETGLLVRPDLSPEVGEEPGVLPMPLPHHVQVESIDGEHEHIDLVYRCQVIGGEMRSNAESEALRWFSLEDLHRFPVGPNVRQHATTFLSERPAGARAPRKVRKDHGRSRRGPARRRTSRSVG
ncbi:MAG: NUDIX domain-containing protein [Euryarchaeota archaeon]|nr:NUDIX domain-containing protein [Euryarchaeota archaeon]MDE1836275.1 NUDIX domain-containing protein [Euryarchaeota archaeon]MDE1880903.1 NUDIX domain-containing protein [Euryarchaeota archaeon]MDE2044329.1 NUDIX domain-containing protein [Thermoplasmata archaeon]